MPNSSAEENVFFNIQDVRNNNDLEVQLADGPFYGSGVSVASLFSRSWVNPGFQLFTCQNIEPQYIS